MQDLFAKKVTYAKEKPQVKDLYETFKDAFPQVRSIASASSCAKADPETGGQEPRFLPW